MKIIVEITQDLAERALHLGSSDTVEQMAAKALKEYVEDWEAQLDAMNEDYKSGRKTGMSLRGGDW